ncbi:MAG: carboxylating nicotinate-nucleotide diphosphorylase [Chitinispirillaceae bacterium]|nr:carboxylating nicotinate-nucleotide diphosphorylase [Chitinispirillaceae bacterium]
MTITEHDLISRIVGQALEEDLGSAGDVTSTALFSPGDTAAAIIRSKSTGVLSGTRLIEPVFSRCDQRIELDIQCIDGAPLEPGTVICTATGPVRGILAGERTVLNFLQRLSGIATLTSRFAGAIAHTKARILDTRKTAPMLRFLEKQAVLHGGGGNHRFGLYDMILIKSTHVRHGGGVVAALERALAFRNSGDRGVKIEIEVQSFGEFTTASGLGPDRIMLDNMPPEAMRRCVAHRDVHAPAVELEASGSITLDTVAAVAETGIDFISIGVLTHSAPALDIHLIIQ